MQGRQLESQEAAHRVANNVGSRNLQVIQKPDGVLDHLDPILVGYAGLAGKAVAPAIEGNHFILPGQLLDDSGEGPLKLAVGPKSMNEENRLAAAFNGIVNGHAVGIKRLVGGSKRS